ncbi:MULTISPECIES: SGNH/GDSL hydrolase family protein [Bacillaceae]|uniref:Lysophospholipase L1-like esterase n=1 Tax=Peribacillus huizhouensis TaxID=1501239 RepID=A0ABR6CS03_9BACI|nr:MULTISPECIES: SGNH/GDSL hydrolase family protein [Bacillaceae]MBA9027701.1 lysophospholipase L1-like esterase [Peribacillus huizhouensis]
MKSKIIMTFIALFLTTSILFVFLLNQKTYGNETLPNVYEKIKTNKPIRYLVIGDSIGRGSGAATPEERWFVRLENMMKQKENIKISGDYIVQSGATAFEGLYNFSQTTIKEPPDLVFIVFGENDRKYMSANDFGEIYEALVRKVKTRFPNAEIFTITESSLTFYDFADEIMKISRHYGTAHLDMRPVFAKSGLSMEQLTKDFIHPNGIGYQLYANEIYSQLLSHTIEDKVIAPLSIPLYRQKDLNLIKINKPSRINGFNHSSLGFVSELKGNYIEYDFTGTILGGIFLRTPIGGKLDVFIDGNYTTTIDTWWPFSKERYLYITNGLSNGIHKVRFETSGTKSLMNLTGKADVHIISIITNK